MTRRPFSPWQRLAALAPLLLLLTYLPGQMMLRCRLDGRLRDVCCCPQGNERPSSEPVVKAQDCCDRAVTHNERPTAEAARGADHDVATVAPVAAAIALVSPIESPRGRFTAAAQRHGPAYGRPPLVLLKHAFLI